MGLFYRRQEGSFHLCFWLATNSCSSWNTISWNKSQYLFIGFLTKSWVGHSNFTFYSSVTKWPAQIHFFLIIWFGFPNVWCKCLSFPHCVLHVQLFKTVFCICSTFHNCGAYLIFVTDTRTVSVEKKSVMWRNFKFLYMTDEEKSKISSHVD